MHGNTTNGTRHAWAIPFVATIAARCAAIAFACRFVRGHEDVAVCPIGDGDDAQESAAGNDDVIVPGNGEPERIGLVFRVAFEPQVDAIGIDCRKGHATKIESFRQIDYVCRVGLENVDG